MAGGRRAWPGDRPARRRDRGAGGRALVGGAEAQSFRGAEFAARPEGFRIDRDGDSVIVTGNDARGVLYGVGWLLRHLEVRRSSVLLPDALLDGGPIRSAPHYPLRGHQIGYRPKTNSYAGWTVAEWEQYVRELAIFGANAVEVIPPVSDDAPDSDHFPLPQIDMMREVSAIAGPLRRGPVDLVSRPGVRLRRRCDGTARPRRVARGVCRPAEDRRRVHSRRRSGIDAGESAAGTGRNGRRRRCTTCTRGRRCGSLRRGSTAPTRSTSTRRWKMGSTGWMG